MSGRYGWGIGGPWTSHNYLMRFCTELRQVGFSSARQCMPFCVVRNALFPWHRTQAVLPVIYRTMRARHRLAMQCALPLLSCIPAGDIPDIKAELLYADYLEAIWDAANAGGMLVSPALWVAMAAVHEWLMACGM